MSWIPPNIAEACVVHTTITSCQPQTFLFLQLVTQLFGQSKDNNNDNNFNNNNFNYDFSKYFDFTLPSFSSYDNQQPTIEEFDFVVAGAGSAGCVVANRLSEVPHWRILLLEAGDEEPEVAGVPSFPPLLQRSSIDWAFMTQPSPHSCRARRNGQCLWVRGKVMGGSSTVNYMIYTRGHPKDYDEWEELGNPGWSYRDVLPYFKKSENNGDYDRIDPDYHGYHGYLSVQRFNYQDKNTVALLKAFEELGLENLDQTTEHLIGTSLLQFTQKHGMRHSANVAFIRPIRRKRKNLLIRTNSYVIRVLINPKTKVAYGIEYLRNGRIYQAIAKKEVIVSTGAIMSPKVLMLSGIGPADELIKYNIPIIADLKVGYNLQDHTTIDGVVFTLTNKTSTLLDRDQLTDELYYYKKTHEGILSNTGTLQVNAFVQTKYENDFDRPDIQFSLDTANVENIVEDPILSAETNVNPLTTYNGVMIRPVLLSPKSRGYIQLNTTDPVFGTPLIHTNTFFEDIDLLRIVEGVKQSLNLLKTNSLRKLGYSLLAEPWPACQKYHFGTDPYWMCIATSYTTTIFHSSCTCKMGPKHDHYAVVDNELSVHGIHNLRVIDSSIMPIIVRGNTNAPTIMIAEKGSDMIKAKWLKDYNHKSSIHNGDDLFDK